MYVIYMHDDLQLDFNQLLDDQGPVDVIIHKLTDHINRSLDHGQEALKWIEMVQVCLFLFFVPYLMLSYLIVNKKFAISDHFLVNLMLMCIVINHDS